MRIDLLQPASTNVSRQRGVVTVITLLAMLLLVGLVFYVINLGRQVNTRVVTQNAADSAAMGGAGWVARSLNVVAMNNVEMARLIAVTNVLEHEATDRIGPRGAAAIDPDRDTGQRRVTGLVDDHPGEVTPPP